MKNVLTTDNRGFSLVELMVTTAIVGVMATAGAQLMIQQGKQQSAMAQKAVFTALSSTVAATLSSPAAILWSTNPTRAPAGSGNATLHTCLVPAHPDPTLVPADPAPPSLTCTAGVPGTDDALFDLYQNNNSTPITGFYDLTGNRLAAVTTTTACTANPKCRFQVTAKFIPNCPAVTPMVNPCNKPESLVLTYSLAQVNKPAGTTAIGTVATSSASGATSPGFTMPYSMIYASSYIKADCRLLHPASTAELIADPTLAGPPLKASPLYSTVVGVDDLGQPICGPDPNQGAITALTQQYCQLKMVDLWTHGGTIDPTSPCEPATVIKKFKLTSYGSNGYTTDNCVAPDKRIMPNGSTDYSFTSGAVVSPSILASIPGGILSGTTRTEADFISHFSLVPNTIFSCQSRSSAPTTAPRSWVTSINAPLGLPQNYVPGSLIFTGVGGGGGGGGGGNDGTCAGGGGHGGKHGIPSTIPFFGVIDPATSCNIIIGTAGNHGGGDGDGSSGTDTTINCTTGDSLLAGFGLGGGKGCRGWHCSGSGNAENGEDSPLYGSGMGFMQGCDNGTPGTQPGASGAGGSGGRGCVDCAYDGANGAAGILNGTWNEYTWAAWM